MDVRFRIFTMLLISFIGYGLILSNPIDSYTLVFETFSPQWKKTYLIVVQYVLPIFGVISFIFWRKLLIRKNTHEKT